MVCQGRFKKISQKVVAWISSQLPEQKEGLFDNSFRISQTTVSHYLRLYQTKILDYFTHLRQKSQTISYNYCRLSIIPVASLGNYKDFDTVLKQSQISILNNIGQLSTISMVISGNFKENYDTGNTTANKPQCNSILFRYYLVFSDFGPPPQLSHRSEPNRGLKEPNPNILS